MSSRASPKFLERVQDMMRMIVTVRGAVFAIIAAATFGGLAYGTGLLSLTPNIAGTWTFNTQGTSSCGVPYDGWSVPVWQEGNTFYGNTRPEPVIKNGVISGKDVTFSIVIENADSIDGCGDFSELIGAVSSNEITGIISGHDCDEFCVWEGTFKVVITK